MEFRIFVEPQLGASTADQIRMATTAEELGFDGFFRSDHLLTMGDNDGLPGPTDSWITLAAVAMSTSRIRLGTLVSSATFRHPSMLAVQVAQVDDISGGRVELGLGTGWFEAEHTAYGIAFPRQRFGPFEEQLEIITGLWNTPIGETYSFVGAHFTLDQSPALPKPAQAHVPIIVGGSGPSRTPAIAARFADEYNSFRAPTDEILARFARLDAACHAIGRDPASIVRSIAVTTEPTMSATEVVDTLATISELGVSRFYLQLLNLQNLDRVAFLADEVLPHLQER